MRPNKQFVFYSRLTRQSIQGGVGPTGTLNRQPLQLKVTPPLHAVWLKMFLLLLLNWECTKFKSRRYNPLEQSITYKNFPLLQRILLPNRCKLQEKRKINKRRCNSTQKETTVTRIHTYKPMPPKMKPLQNPQSESRGGNYKKRKHPFDRESDQEKKKKKR